jgi:isopentenyl-diphosphate delta-isomerase
MQDKNMNDYVVLVNEKNEPMGTKEKLEAHSAQTPLHRGFSLFLFNHKKELLLQQRSKKKKTWPGVWTNSCCGHPMLEESPIAAARRRLVFELGIQTAEVTMILPNYRYRFEKDGIVENEFCPVMIGYSDQQPLPNPDEVQAVRWIPWVDWITETKKNPASYSPWCVEETQLLVESKNIL